MGKDVNPKKHTPATVLSRHFILEINTTKAEPSIDASGPTGLQRSPCASPPPHRANGCFEDYQLSCHYGIRLANSGQAITRAAQLRFPSHPCARLPFRGHSPT